MNVKDQQVLARPEQRARPSLSDADRRPRRTTADYVLIAVKGLCMGSADVVPGVSGGTIAFITGIYEELISAIRMAGRPEFLKALLSFRLKEAARLLNFPFLLALGSGIIIAILSLARLMQRLLANQPVMIWSFFFGLVFASVVVVSRKIRRWNPLLVTALAAGAVGAYVLVGLVPVQTPDAPWFVFLSGAVAICAMILPGISGAFILVLLGKYHYMLGALIRGDLVTIITFVSGAAIGLVSFSQMLNWLFRRYHDPTVALLRN